MTGNSPPKASGPGRRDPVDLLTEYCQRYRLDDAVESKLRALLTFLERDEHAPTTVRAGVAAVETHFADSLVALDLLDLEADLVGADLGTGAGFPGAVLAAAMPKTKIYLVESVGRKCNFIEMMLSDAKLEGAVVINSRAESWLAGLGQCDFITARALATLAVIGEYAAPLLKVGGRLIAWKGARDQEEESQAEKAFETLGLKISDIRPVKPFPDVRNRHLYIVEKVSETPKNFPRRPGMALKKPLWL